MHEISFSRFKREKMLSINRYYNIINTVVRSIYVPFTVASLEVLSEDVITEQLQKRFESNQIYTYIGDILVAVNPFTNLGLYTRQHQKRYVGKSRFENPPHIFAVADAAHQVRFCFFFSLNDSISRITLTL